MSAGQTQRLCIRLAFLTGIVGAICGVVLSEDIKGAPTRAIAVAPMPYRLAPSEDVATLRLAMVHDIVHERYLSSGEAAWEARVKKWRAALDAHEGPPDEALWDAYDSLGEALDKLHRSDEAAALLQEKLARLEATGAKATLRIPGEGVEGLSVDGLVRAGFLGEQPLSVDSRRFYHTHANLGTFLIHGAFKDARLGDAAARARLEEGLGHILRSVRINPLAHYGREVWQIVAVQNLLRAIDDPKRLTRLDLIGQSLAFEVEDARHVGMTIDIPDSETLEHLDSLQYNEAPDREVLLLMREMLTRVEPAEPASGMIFREPVAFDQPVLGMLGMWTLGGGPNPHFALSLGLIMERVGQRQLALACYARAKALLPRFWPDDEVQAAVGDWLDRRISEVGFEWSETQELLAGFEAELAKGQAMQAEFHAFEAARIAEGADPDDPKILSDFVLENGEISTSPGLEDDFVEYYLSERPRNVVIAAVALFFAGLGAWLGLRISGRKGQA